MTNTLTTAQLKGKKLTTREGIKTIDTFDPEGKSPAGVGPKEPIVNFTDGTWEYASNTEPYDFDPEELANE